MSTTGMIHVRVDEDVKIQATDALAMMGLSLSEAVRVFLKRIAVEQAFPFALRVPNPVTQAAMEEARAMGQARFASAEDLLDGLAKASKP
jgi:DNA-damage-inducible protein J